MRHFEVYWMKKDKEGEKKVDTNDLQLFSEATWICSCL